MGENCINHMGLIYINILTRTFPNYGSRVRYGNITIALIHLTKGQTSVNTSPGDALFRPDPINRLAVINRHSPHILLDIT